MNRQKIAFPPPNFTPMLEVLTILPNLFLSICFKELRIINNGTIEFILIVLFNS